MTALWYHLRLQVNAGTLAILALPLAAGIFTYGQPDPLPFAELFWPVGAPVLMAALISREWEGGTAEVLFARPASRGRCWRGGCWVPGGGRFIGWCCCRRRYRPCLPALSLAGLLPGGH